MFSLTINSLNLRNAADWGLTATQLLVFAYIYEQAEGQKWKPTDVPIESVLAAFPLAKETPETIAQVYQDFGKKQLIVYNIGGFFSRVMLTTKGAKWAKFSYPQEVRA